MSDAEPSSTFLSVRDLDVCCEQHGPEDGPRVLLISGTGGDLRTDPHRHRHPARARRMPRAHVRPARPRAHEQARRPYSMEDYADDAAALMDAVGWQRAHVIGISFGGMVAQHVAIRHGGRVDRLVLACTSSGGAGGSSFDLLAIADLPPAERERIALSVMDSRTDLTTDPPTIAPGLAPFLAAMRQRGAAGEGDPAAAAEQARGARLQLEARAGHDTWDRLGAVTARTLVIGGRFDRQAPPENLERLASRIPDARLVMCDGGHLFVLQDPSAWPAIAEFLLAA